MGLVVASTEAFRAHVGIDLGGCQAGMPQEFLHDPQVCPAFKQVGRRAVPKTMGREIWPATNTLGRPMDCLPDLARIDSSAPPTEEDRRWARSGGQLGPAVKPVLKG